MRRIRLVTLILLIAILAQGLALYVQHRRTEQLRSALFLYRNHAQEEMLHTLEKEYDFYLSGWKPAYGKAMPLEDVLKMVKTRTKGTWMPNGFPIYVDPIGLQEAEKTMMTPVGTDPADGPLPLGDHLRRILKPMGLAYKVEDGLLVITSEEAMDVPSGDAKGRDLTDVEVYRRYRDVLK
jgi:hypothetical protein